MTAPRGNCLIGQSGGPTAVINSSLCGVIQEAMHHPEIESIYGARHGIVGALSEDLVGLRMEDPKEIELLKSTPAAALGSCRYRLPESTESTADYHRLLEVFNAHKICYFFYMGGNDSMDTANKIAGYAQRQGYELRVIGIPKTVDNDLAGTDHAPGYGSVAKHIAAITRSVGLDMQSVHVTDPVVVMEVMGRNAGWITAASALARQQEGDAPNLIYVPEATWSKERFLDDVKRTHATYGWCYITVSVGVKDETGNYLAAPGGRFAKDIFGHTQLGGVGPMLENLIRSELGLKTRLVRLGPAERVAAHFISLTDRDEAYELGAFAVQAAICGVSKKMTSLVRAAGSPYHCDLGLTDLDLVANHEKKIPREWLNEPGNDVINDFHEYARPLIQGEATVPIEAGLPRYARLRLGAVEKKLGEYSASNI